MMRCHKHDPDFYDHLDREKALDRHVARQSEMTPEQQITEHLNRVLDDLVNGTADRPALRMATARYCRRRGRDLFPEWRAWERARDWKGNTADLINLRASILLPEFNREAAA